MGGVNLVAGFRPELWRGARPGGHARGTRGLRPEPRRHRRLRHAGHAARRRAVAVRKRLRRRLRRRAQRDRRTRRSWHRSPRRRRAGPTGTTATSPASSTGRRTRRSIEAPDVALVPEGRPGAGGTILLLQKWEHDATAWESMPEAEQERTIGRTKLDSEELEDKTDELARRAARTRTRSGRSSAATCRTAPSPSTGRCSWASAPSRGHSQRCSRAWPASARAASATHSPVSPRRLTGAYYFVPSTDALRRLVPSEEG